MTVCKTYFCTVGEYDEKWQEIEKAFADRD